MGYISNFKTGKVNIAFGWCWLFVGILAAMAMGLYAFKVHWLGGYTSLPRRFLRLSHISSMALSLTNIIYGFSLDSANLSVGLKKIGSYLMIMAAICMPLICLLCMWKSIFQSLFFIPALSFAIAVLVMAAGQLKIGDK